MTLAVLILAAGRSARMSGKDKLLEDVDGAPCLRVMAQRVLDSGLPVFITLPDLSHPRARTLEGLNVTNVPVPDAGDGMARSISRGVAALGSRVSGVMILPADMPALQTDDFRLLATRFQNNSDAILRLTTPEGRPGHPVVFPSKFFDALKNLHGDTGARDIVRDNRDIVLGVLADDERAVTDLDTPQDWAAWRTHSGKK